MNSPIEYIYFDADNLVILKSLEDLKNYYFKGESAVFESVYPHMPSGQILHSMSSTRESELSLRIKLQRIKK